eukprot:jgi/Ulvmu1/8865/UM049_0047.1
MTASTPVIVNVYDLADFNSYLNWAGLGAYHTGVQCHGREYAFGAHPYDCSGIFDTAPMEAPGEVAFRCSIQVGETSYSEDELLEVIDEMGLHYSGQRYHLLQQNCNNFSSDLCFALCGNRPPGWTNRLAGVAVALHCLCPSSIVPPLQPPTMLPGEGNDTPAPRSQRGSGDSSEGHSLLQHIAHEEEAPLPQELLHGAASATRWASMVCPDDGHSPKFEGPSDDDEAKISSPTHKSKDRPSAVGSLLHLDER